MIGWSEKFELGITAIDEQHKEWVSIINQLFVPASPNLNREQAIIVLLEKVNDYAMFHFFYEEQLLRKFGYSQTLEHREEHLAFAQRLLKYQKDALNGEAPMAAILVKEMLNWLHTHICIEDRKYVEFLKMKGVA